MTFRRRASLFSISFKGGGEKEPLEHIKVQRPLKLINLSFQRGLALSLFPTWIIFKIPFYVTALCNGGLINTLRKEKIKVSFAPFKYQFFCFLFPLFQFATSNCAKCRSVETPPRTLTLTPTGNSEFPNLTCRKPVQTNVKTCKLASEWPQRSPPSRQSFNAKSTFTLIASHSNQHFNRYSYWLYYQ